MSGTHRHCNDCRGVVQHDVKDVEGVCLVCAAPANQKGWKDLIWIVFGVGQVMKNAAREVGIDPTRAHPHAFRHTYGRNCVLRGIPIPVLQKWLGHQSLKDTQGYVELAGAHHEWVSRL